MYPNHLSRCFFISASSYHAPDIILLHLLFIICNFCLFWGSFIYWWWFAVVLRLEDCLNISANFWFNGALYFPLKNLFCGFFLLLISLFFIHIVSFIEEILFYLWRRFLSCRRNFFHSFFFLIWKPIVLSNLILYLLKVTWKIKQYNSQNFLSMFFDNLDTLTLFGFLKIVWAEVVRVAAPKVST